MLERLPTLHTVGRFQSPVACVVLDGKADKIIGASSNLCKFVPDVEAETAIGQDTRDVLGPKIVHQIRNAATLSSFETASEYLGTWDRGGSAFDAWAFSRTRHVIVELFRSKSVPSAIVLARDIAGLNERISASDQLEALLSAVARPLRILSGYDRVQFLVRKPDTSHLVLAESRHGAVDASIGESRASDTGIGKKLGSGLALVADSQTASVEILCSADLRLDLRLAQAAPPPRTQLDVLDRSHMRAELVQPLVVECENWGALVFQNRRPRTPSLRFNMVLKAILPFLCSSISRLART